MTQFEHGGARVFYCKILLRTGVPIYTGKFWLQDQALEAAQAWCNTAGKQYPIVAIYLYRATDGVCLRKWYVFGGMSVLQPEQVTL